MDSEGIKKEPIVCKYMLEVLSYSKSASPSIYGTAPPYKAIYSFNFIWCFSYRM